MNYRTFGCVELTLSIGYVCAIPMYNNNERHLESDAYVHYPETGVRAVDSLEASAMATTPSVNRRSSSPSPIAA
jgi:hypothetical protein